MVILIMGLTATLLAIWAISYRSKDDLPQWRFVSNAVDGHQVMLVVTARDFDHANKLAKESIKAYGANYFHAGWFSVQTRVHPGSEFIKVDFEQAKPTEIETLQQ